MKCPCPCTTKPKNLPGSAGISLPVLEATSFSATKPGAQKPALNDPGSSSFSKVLPAGQKWIGTLPSPCGETELSEPFDFAVLRYRWESTGGEDLDTRTQVVTPLVNFEVGWNRDAASPNPNGYTLNACQPNGYGIDPDATYLLHGGDNCDFGVEAILINFIKLQADFPDAEQFAIRMRAFWYDVLSSGDITLEFETYLGGVMTHLDYDFINSGGSPQQTLTVPRNVQLNQSSNIDGESVGQLIFSVSTKTAVITDV